MEISATEFDPSTDPVVNSLGDVPGATVQSIRLLLAGAHLECDFTKQVASSISKRTLSIESLLESGLEVLRPGAAAEELATIRSIIDPVPVDDAAGAGNDQAELADEGE